MITFVFTEAQKQALDYERFHHPHPRVQKKMEALWLKSQGLAHQEITKLAGISANTLRSYLPHIPHPQLSHEQQLPRSDR
jgi:hypothetical protein